MAYKTILVSLNEVARLPQLIAAASELGRTFEAHVAGFYVVPAVQVYPSVGFEAAPQVFEGNRTYFKDNAPKVREAFEAAMKRDGLTFDFHLDDARSPVIADEVIATGRAADLIIISATNPEEVTGVERDFVEQVMMGAGRPVLVLPYQGEAKVDLSDVILGWDGGREAARAAFDAMPILKRRKKCGWCGPTRRRTRRCAGPFPAPILPKHWRAMVSKPRPWVIRPMAWMPGKRCCAVPMIPAPGLSSWVPMRIRGSLNSSSEVLRALCSPA